MTEVAERNWIYMDAEAPMIAAYERRQNNLQFFMVWCPPCERWHGHGDMDGHRVSHCAHDIGREYWGAGYNIVRVGKWSDLSSAEKKHGPEGERTQAELVSLIEQRTQEVHWRLVRG